MSSVQSESHRVQSLAGKATSIVLQFRAGNKDDAIAGLSDAGCEISALRPWLDRRRDELASVSRGPITASGWTYSSAHAASFGVLQSLWLSITVAAEIGPESGALREKLHGDYLAWEAACEAAADFGDEFYRESDCVGSLDALIELERAELSENGQGAASGESGEDARTPWWKNGPPTDNWGHAVPVNGTLDQLSRWIGQDVDTLKNHNGQNIWIERVNGRNWNAYFKSGIKYSEVNAKKVGSHTAPKTESKTDQTRGKPK